MAGVDRLPAATRAPRRELARGETLFACETASPIGRLRLASTAAGLAYVELPHASGRGLAGWLARFAPGARGVTAADENRCAADQILEFLAGERTAFDLALDLRATPFQRRVLDAVAKIPYGETRAYAEIAAAIGAPHAVRAVGAANGANPLALVIPCHRVIASNGRLQGYGGGLDLKARLLAMERQRATQGRLL
jgi:O-6-methylguanine DNA methyltransferase